VKPILDMLKKCDIHGLCHVTGGGITENLPRILPKNLCAEIDPNSWQRLPIFDWIQRQGDIADEEMLRVFNSGIGMIVVVSAEQQDIITNLADQHQINSDMIGVIKNTSSSSQVRYL
jgi:phosphoribosylformylglycinamidine cyclo-ligase